MTCFLWPFAHSLRPPHPSILSYTLWIPFRLKGNSHKIWLVPALSVQEQASFLLLPVVAPLGKCEFGNIISSIRQVFGQHLEMCTTRHITVKIAINCSANFDATVIALFKLVLDNRINHSLRGSVGNVDATGISHISWSLERARLFGSLDSACESLFTFSLVFTFSQISLSWICAYRSLPERPLVGSIWKHQALEVNSLWLYSF